MYMLLLFVSFLAFAWSVVNEERVVLCDKDAVANLESPGSTDIMS